MDDDNPHRSGYSAAVLLGSVLALAGAVWLAVLLYNQFNPPTEVVQSERGVPLLPAETSAETASVEAEAADDEQPSAPDSSMSENEPGVTESAQADMPEQEPVLLLTPRLFIDSNLGTGSSEFSAVALNEDTNRLLIADDDGRLFEFDLDDDGLPITPLRRTLSVRVGAGDIEGLSWMFGNTYAIAHENDGQITVVEIGDDLTEITSEQLIRTVDTLIREDDGKGLEGVTYVPGDGAIEFVVVEERPPTMYLIGRRGEIISAFKPDTGVSDFSDIYASSSGAYSVLSDEGRVVIEVTVEQNSVDEWVVASTDGAIDLVVRAGQFAQPEGLVRSRDGTRLYIVGEAPGPDRFSFGFWSSS